MKYIYIILVMIIISCANKPKGKWRIYESAFLDDTSLPIHTAINNFTHSDTSKPITERGSNHPMLKGMKIKVPIITSATATVGVDTAPSFKIIGKPIITHRVIYVANKGEQIEAVSDTSGNWVLEGGSFSEFMEIFYKEHSKMIKMLQKKVDSLKEVADSYEYLLNDCIMASDTSIKIVDGFFSGNIIGDTVPTKGTPPPYTVKTDSAVLILGNPTSDSLHYGTKSFTTPIPFYPYDNRPEYDTSKVVIVFIDTTFISEGVWSYRSNPHINWIFGYNVERLQPSPHSYGLLYSRYYQHDSYLDNQKRPLNESLLIIMSIKVK